MGNAEEADRVGGASSQSFDLPRRQVIITLAGVMLAMFLGSIDQTVVGTAMPRIISELGGFDRYTWVTTAYLVTSTMMVPIVGRLTDMYGRKWFYIAGIIIFLVGSVLSGTSQTLNQLIIYRALQGIGGGIMMANAFIVIGDLFSPAERGKYQGLTSAVFGLSSIIGPVVGGAITDHISWHWIFYVNLPLGIPVVFLFIKYFPDIAPARTRHKIDVTGLVLLMLAVVAIMLGLSWGGVQYEWGSPQVIGALGAGLAMVLLFIPVELRAEEPIMPLRVFRNRIVFTTIIITFFAGFGMFGAIVFIPLYFQGVLGFTATRSGSFLTPMMLGMVVASVLSGQALSRLGGHYRAQGLFGLAMMATGIYMMSRMGVETSYARAVLNLVTTGLGLGTALPLLTIVVQNAVSYQVMGMATSAVQFFRQIGATLGLAVLGSIMASQFSRELLGNVPAELNGVLPSDLSALAENPEALMNPEALEAIGSQFGQLGPGAVEAITQLLRQSLSSAIGHVFFIAFFGVLLAAITMLFLKEIPLKRSYKADKPGEGASRA